MARLQKRLVVCLAVYLASTTFAVGGAEDDAIGQVMAASLVADRCADIGPIGGGDAQQFVFAAADLLAEQGFGRQKMRGVLFYAKTEALEAEGVRILAARGVAVDDQAALCRFGSQVAGTVDAIGRFMVKGD